MNKPGLLFAAMLISSVGSGLALGQGRGTAPGAGGSGSGAVAPGGWNGGGAGASRGGYGGGRQSGGQAGYWYRSGPRGGYHGGYGPGAGVYFGGPPAFSAYPFPYYYPYAVPRYSTFPGYYPYPVYVRRRPAIYIQKPRVVAVATPPPAVRAPAPRFERYTLSARELFAFDRADLGSPQPKLDKIAAVLVGNPQLTGITINGYTDRLGPEAYNLNLAQRRADTVKAYLVGKGVAANRLTAIGRGEANPVVQCAQMSWAALVACLEPNRRVEIEQITIERRIG